MIEPRRVYSEAIETKYEAVATDRRFCTMQRQHFPSHPIVSAVDAAEPYFMSREVCASILESSNTMPLDFVFHGQTLCGHRPHGWLLIDGGIETPDITNGLSGRTTNTITAVAWGYGRANSKWGPNHAIVPDDNERGWVLNIGGFSYVKGQLVWLPCTFMRDGDSVAADSARRRESIKSEPARVQALDILVRFVLAAFVWMEQRLLVTESQRPDRATRRRLERSGVNESSINVVMLRRPERQDHEAPEKQEWLCQWIVKGHWRQQFYPSKNGHQPIWIMPHLKGPDDKPLKAPSQKVFGLVR